MEEIRCHVFHVINHAFPIGAIGSKKIIEM